MKKYLSLSICLFFIFLSTGCMPWNSQQSQTKVLQASPQINFSAVDSRGKEIVLHQKPQRIISLAPSNTEILFALGLDKEIVGITDYCDYPPEKVSQKGKIGGFSTPNIEKIVSLNPDIVFATTGVQKQAIERLERLGVNIYLLEAENIESLIAEIEKVGKLTGKSHEAQNLIGDLEKRMNAVRTKVGNLLTDQKPKVFLEIWYDPLWTAPNKTLIYQIVELAGGRNAITIEGEWDHVTTVDPEAVINANPDVILLAFEGGDPTLVYKLPGWGNISAVKNKKVFPIDADIISRPCPRIIDALEQIAKILHPELF